jgi:transposase
MRDLDISRAVFLDETSVDTAMHERFGWAPIGETPMIEGKTRGSRRTVIGAIGVNGPVGVAIIDGALNGELFLQVLENNIGPGLPPGAILLMDQLFVHDVEGVDEVLAKFGATAMFLPRYSPEFNPIELCWAWIKRYLRKHAKRAIADLIDLLSQLWFGVSASFCAGWIRHCGYTLDAPVLDST